MPVPIPVIRVNQAYRAARMNDPHKQLAIEVAANRLILRALLASLFVSGGEHGQRLGKAVRAAADAMAPDALRLDSFDIETQIEAVQLLRKRTMAMLAELVDPSDHSHSSSEKTHATI